MAVYICIHRIIANTHTHTHPTHPSNYTHTHTNKIRTVYHETHKKISILSIYNYIHINVHDTDKHIRMTNF